MNPNELVKGFGKSWAEKMERGEVSGWSRVEEIMLEIFAKWICRNYTVERKTDEERTK